MEKLLATSSTKRFWELKNTIERFIDGDPSLRPAACIRIVKLLVGYKVVDIMCWLSTGGMVQNIAYRGHRQSFTTLKSFKVWQDLCCLVWPLSCGGQGWPFLSDWCKTLQDFKRDVTTRREHTCLLDSENDPGIYNLLRNFIDCAKMWKAEKATINLAIASLDITNRLHTKLQEGDIFPELPTSFDDWGIEGQERLSTEEVSILHSLFTTASKTNSLRWPLELASLLSPIILLAPINLHKQSVNSSELVKVKYYASVLLFEHHSQLALDR